MKVNELNTFVSCIQSQQMKMEEFAKLKGGLCDIDNTTINQIKNLANGVEVKKRKITDVNVKDINEITEVNDDQMDTKEEEEKVYKWDIVWINVFILGFLHLGALYGFYLRLFSVHLLAPYSMILKIIGMLASIGVTGGAHRLWTHKSYQANTAMQCLLMFMVTLTYQNSIYTWARDHRLHHKCSETDGDPHNAKRGFFFSHVGWLMVKKHPDVKEQGKTIDMSDLKANPIVMFQHKYYYPMVLIFALVMPLSLGLYWEMPWQEAFFICVCYKYVLSVNITWCINSVAHLYGQRPYDKNIGPTESQIMRYLGFGEGFHNYHHTFPWDYKAAEFGTDTRNITTSFIDFFAWLGWAKNLRVASEEMIEKRCARTGGPGREYHMKKDSPDRTVHNIASFLMFSLYIYLI